MYDVVVIGLGGVGSFALRALAKQLRGQNGGKILGIERFQRGHTKGSSHGESRLYRRAYFEDERYIPWLDYSIQEFEKLEQEQNVSLLHRCGNLILQDKPDKSTPLKKNYLQLAMDTAHRHNIEVEFLEQDTLKWRFPQFRYHDDAELIGLLEPGAGFVRPERAVLAALEQAEAEEGVDIWEDTTVKFLKENSLSGNDKTPNVEIIVDRGEEIKIVTRTVLIAAGAWASQLIPSWSEHLTVTRQVQGWLDVSQSADSNLYEAGTMPTWIMATKKWHLPFFGVPVVPTDTSDAGFAGKPYIKIGSHNDVDKIDNPTNNPAEITKAEREEYQCSVEVAIDDRAWGNGDPSMLLKTMPCMYTMTPDEDFIIGVPEEFQNVYAVAGLSGHGFKMTPALGQMLADFHLVGEEQLNAKWKPQTFCSPSRFHQERL